VGIVPLPITPTLTHTTTLPLPLPHSLLPVGIPPEWGQCRKLEKLALQDNNLEGCIPPELFTGEAPSSIVQASGVGGRMPSMVIDSDSSDSEHAAGEDGGGGGQCQLCGVSVSYNRLWGPIPTAIGYALNL
jgi:hypothetical protein